MTIVQAILLLSLPARMDIAGALSRSMIDSSEYINPGYTTTVTEIDVPALGAARDSIHTMMIIENLAGFDSSNNPFAVLLFRDELVRVVIINDQPVITRYSLDLTAPRIMYCDPLGGSALVIGPVSPNLLAPADLFDFQSGSSSRLYLKSERQSLPEIHLFGGTLLVLYEDSAVCFDRSGSSLFSSALLNRSSTVRIIDGGESLLTTGERSGLGARIIKLSLVPDTVWVLDTGRRNPDLVSPDQDGVGFFRSIYRSTPSDFIRELFSFDLRTGEILSHDEFQWGPAIEYTSPNGLYWCRMHTMVDSPEELCEISAGAAVLGERHPLHHVTVDNINLFHTLKVVNISNTGRILFRYSRGYSFSMYLLTDHTGEVIWCSELLMETDFPSYRGTFTDWKYPPAQLTSAGDQVLYSNRHKIRILTFNKED